MPKVPMLPVEKEGYGYGDLHALQGNSSLVLDSSEVLHVSV